ncbi:MAG TPA: DUF177 domain-containing protein [Thermomicrobiales bacterium]|nr:DUF177 domain-containing protein [Thermomicrobiales bacterium]
MTVDRGHDVELRNETAINVAGLLKGATGEARHYRLTLDRFPLGDGLIAHDVTGRVKLTRLREGVIARVEVEGVVPLECVRCLRTYDQAFATSFAEEYRQTVDLRTGVDLAPASNEDDDTAHIDENHELDLGEALRQEILVSLPMRPDCGAGCPGPESLAGEREPAAAIDDRFAALADLLTDDDMTDAPAEPGRDRERRGG